MHVACTFILLNVPGSWSVGTIEKAGADERDLVKKNPARPAPAFSIVPTDREPETGYYLSGLDASPSQGYLTILNLAVLIYSPEWKEAL